MSNNRSVRAGDTIPLRVRFRDDTGEISPATEVYIHIFEPDKDTDDLSQALVISGVATNLGEDIWEYQYTVPSTGPAGSWEDKWQGKLTYQSLTALFSFNVVASGTIEDLGNQLNQNNYITVTLQAGIAATDGTTLDNDYTFSFLTIASPIYTSVRKVLLEAGGFIGTVSDLTIQLAILEASLEADVLTFAVPDAVRPIFKHARRQYTTCLTALTLLQNLGIGLRSKTLDNLSVAYDTNSIRDMVTRLLGCVARWEPQILAGGLAATAREPSYVVKGALDPDRPLVSRSWQPASEGGLSKGIPAANTRERFAGQRRFVRTWNNTPAFKKWW